MRRMILACLTASTLLAQGAAEAATKPELIGRFDAWQAYSHGSGPSVVCYAFSTPVERWPLGLKRDPAYLFVTWPRSDKRSKGELSLEMGYPIMAAATSTLAIGSSEFTLMESGEHAWLQDETRHSSAIRAMKRELKATVTTTSRRGNKTRDTYALKGFTQAHDAIREACKERVMPAKAPLKSP
jgi:invasion associated locus B (IalB) protein